MSPITSTIVAVPDWRVEMSILENSPRGTSECFARDCVQMQSISAYRDGEKGSGCDEEVFLRPDQTSPGGLKACNFAKNGPGKPDEAGLSSVRGPAASLPIGRSSPRSEEWRKAPGT